MSSLTSQEKLESMFTFGGTTDRDRAPDPTKDTYFLALFNKTQTTEETFTKVFDIIISNGKKYDLSLNKDSFIFEKFDFELPFDHAVFSVDESCQGAILSSAEAIHQHIGYLKKCKNSLVPLKGFLDKYAPWMLFLLADGGKMVLEKKAFENWYESAQKIFGSAETTILPYFYPREFNGVHYSTLIFRDKSAYNELKKIKKVFINDMEVKILDWGSLSEGSCPLSPLKAQIEENLDPASNFFSIFSVNF